ncbi:MAG: LytTR family DNA-binding domain-containing protein [Bacteroidota bacterium]
MKALIVEDEPLAVDNLTYYLREYPIEIIGAIHRIRDAVRLIHKEQPDVVFLDINLSGENGFDLLDKVDINFKIIFVTAYDEYAVRAFEVNALDYILKPLKKERIAKAIEKLLNQTHDEVIHKKYTIDDTIFLSTGSRACFVKLKDICYIQADSCYSKLFLSETVYRSSTQTLKRWEELLPGNEFLRVHRSFILNINHIGEIKKRKNGTYSVILLGMKNSIEISRRFASNLKNRLSL